MPTNKETITILLDPRARRAQLSLRLGPVAHIRSGRRRDLRVSDLAPFADDVIKLAEQGNLRAYSEGLVQLSVDELRALLTGGGAPAKKAKEAPKAAEVAEVPVEEPKEEEPPAPEEPEDTPDTKPKSRSKKSKKG